MVALMTELLDVAPEHSVLEIGTGSGYQTAVLAEIAAEVYTIELVETLHKNAKKVCEDLNYTNIHFLLGDGNLGWPEFAPFSRIIVTAAPRAIPDVLIDQLEDGGKLVVPVGDEWQQIKIITKIREGNVFIKKGIPVRFVEMKKDIA